MFSFTRLAVLASLAAAAAAQTIQIGYPPDGSKETRGKNFTVQVLRPNSLSSSQEVGIVISVLHCVQTSTGTNYDFCQQTAAGDVLGTILYNGPFNPQYHSSAPLGTQPHQNYSVKIPSTFETGKARFTVSHVALLGAGPSFWTEERNITLNVV